MTLLTIQQVWPGRQGGAVFTGKDDQGKLHRVVAAATVLHRPPGRGEQWDVAGPAKVHPRYGAQIHAERAIPVRPQGELLRRFLARNKAFLGVGEARARKLWDHFGETLYGLLDGQDASSLAEVLGEPLAASLVEAWGETRAEAEVVRWLEAHGFPVALATKVSRLWGVAAPEKIAENPYRMLAVAGWARVDAAALDAGAPPDCPERRIAAVEATCYRVMGDKHTALTEQEILEGIQRLLRCSPETAQEALALAEADHAVVRAQNGLWQSLGPWFMERFVHDRIQERVAEEDAPSGHLFWAKPEDARIQELVEAFNEQAGLNLTVEQQHAVWLAMTQRIGLVLGGAGTGKTSLLKAVHFAQEQTGGHLHAVALAGRAAMRLREATGRSARTLAGFLGALDRQELSLGGSDLVVVDEASMVDLPLAYTLLRRLPSECRVLLVGDPYQLPPIGMGVVFSALAEDPSVPKVELTQIHRQAATTGIPAVARRIRAGEVPELPAFTGLGQGISFLACRPEEAQGHIIETLGLFGGIKETQILSPIRRGPAGITAINAAMHGLCATGKATWSGLATGDPVIHLENDYDALVWNGSLGVVTEALADGARILWDDHEKGITYREDRREALDLGYAISVHKAQGSQFKRVVVPVFPSRILDRTLIYTALTRATEQVVFIGDRSALETAVAAPPAPHRRRTGMVA
ncbi:MAG: ATP-dependent RecD-like DNA helicase [Geothrix sp.]|nr:ATP-dependent RecD-like DNA helicase [Geothrix sp.]